MLDKKEEGIQLVIAAFFTAFIMMIVHMHTYVRPMGQFYWWPAGMGEMVPLTDFFSYYKMLAILTSAVLAVLILVYQVLRGRLTIRYSYAYIPMGIYGLFVILSFVFSEYKEFALWGWNDRFEGTLTLLAYMVMLFFILNIITSEKHVKGIIYAVATSSGLLGFLGMSQAIDKDIFQTGLGKMIITPIYFWAQTETLQFTFQNGEIYQTVYNPANVSFYLTLLIPIFGMIFIREKEKIKKWIWGTLLLILAFNLAGSASICSVGILISALLAVIVLNKKLLVIKKPVAVLLALLLAGGILTMNQYPFKLLNNDVTGNQKIFVTYQESEVISTAPHFGFENHLDFADGRGYIWSRTLPMLRDTVFIGHGADTFCIYFPQDDEAGRIQAKVFSNPEIIVDKPFSMYLRVATGTGVISLLALLALWGIYAVQSFRLYRKVDCEKEFLPAVGAGIFFGVCGFLTAGIFVDSTVSVMPMFYGLLGTGICVNRMLDRPMPDDCITGENMPGYGMPAENASSETEGKS